MKLPKLILAFVVLMSIVLSCHKSNTLVAPASLNIVNAIGSSQYIIPVLGTTDSIQYFSSAAQIWYPSTLLYSPLSGANTIYVVQGNDTSDPKQRLFNGTLNLTAGGIYSFFLSGDTTKADALLVQDQIPYHADSSVGIRFINLSPGSQAISVNLAGNDPTQTEFSGLGYQQISAFKTYPAGSNVGGSYTFEIRDQASGNLLGSYGWGYTLYKNNTIVISGSEDPASSTPFTVFSVNNY